MSFKGHMPRFEGLQKIAPRQPDNLSRSQKLFWRHGWLQANLLGKKTNKGEHSNVFPSIPLDLHFQLVSLDAVQWHSSVQYMEKQISACAVSNAGVRWTCDSGTNMKRF